MKRYSSIATLVYSIILTNTLLSQGNFSNTSGWIEYYHQESKVSLKHPPLWKCYSWSKNNFYIDMNGNTNNKYPDEYGRPVYAFLLATIYDRPIQEIPIFATLRPINISSYDSYEYIVVEKRYSYLLIFLDINGQRHVKFQLFRYVPENPGNIQTWKLLRTVINSFTIRD